MAAYDPDKDLTVRAIIKLELLTNIPVMTKLQPKLSELSKRARFLPLDDDDEYRQYGIELFAMTVQYIHSWVKPWHTDSHSWLKRWHRRSNSLWPSWNNFYMILRGISPELGELADQIETYFYQCSIKQAGSESKGTCNLLLSHLDTVATIPQLHQVQS